MTAARYAARVTEAQMQAAIAELVTMRHGRMFHLVRSDVAPEMVDLPDLLIVDPAGQRLILAELKSAKRRVTPGQAHLMAMARECIRCEAMIVRAGEPREGEVSYDRFLEWLKG